MTRVSELMEKMIAYSDGNRRDINHYVKVYAFARTIGEGEGLSDDEQETLEAAAVIHDIAVPLCRRKYGKTDGPLQEKEGMILAESILEDTDFSDDAKKRIVYLVGHHHTYTGVDGPDYQILLEADYIVNADEHELSRDNIKQAMQSIFKTRTGPTILRLIYDDE